MHEPSPALDPAGDGLVVFGQGEGREDIEAAYRPKAQGTFNPAQTLSTTQFNDVPQAGFDPSGNAFAVWRQSPDTPPASPSQIVASYRGVGANTAFGTAVPLSTSNLSADYPRVGVDGQGRPALWVSTDSSGDDTVQGSSREPARARAAPSSLSTAGDLRADTAGPPDFSVSSAGQAVAVWQRYDGSELIAEAAIGTPPESKPPPPPPPPPAPIPQAINAAAPFERGKAIVLTVTVKGDATDLVWDFSGPNPTVEAGIVDGHLQRSVRLHPTTRELSVKVTAIRPGGSDTYSRTFELPKPLSDPTSVHARNAIDDLNAAGVRRGRCPGPAGLRLRRRSRHRWTRQRQRCGGSRSTRRCKRCPGACGRRTYWATSLLPSRGSLARSRTASESIPATPPWSKTPSRRWTATFRRERR